jgi:Ca2+-transporting ATPase
VGLLVGAAGLGVGLAYWAAGSDAWRTMIFTTLTFAQVGQALAIRSAHDPLYRIGLFSNRALAGLAAAVVGLQLAAVYWGPLGEMFSTVPLGATDLAVSVAAGAAVYVLLEAEKLVPLGLRRAA